MKRFEKIIDATKCPLQHSTKVAEIADPTPSHTPHCDGVYAVCEEEGVVWERKAGGLVCNNGQ